MPVTLLLQHGDGQAHIDHHVYVMTVPWHSAHPEQQERIWMPNR